MSTPRLLLFLNEDVLREILAHLLLDTPRTRNRASILQTCSLLNELGLPLLYRVVNLTGYKQGKDTLVHWRSLFGPAGLFAEGTRKEGKVSVGSFVRELRFERGGGYEQGEWRSFKVPRIGLPLCSTLLVNPSYLQGERGPPLRDIFSQLPIAELAVCDSDGSYYWGESFPIYGYGTAMSHLLGVDPQPWGSLQRIVFDGGIWRDVCSGGKRLSRSHLSSKILVVQVRVDSTKVGVEDAVALFLDPISKKDGRFLEEVERIEFRLLEKFAARIERKFGVQVKKRVARGLTSLEKRILPLVVSISEDGKEKRFAGLE